MGIERVKREFPPKHFSLRIESFSKLAEACTDANSKYESIVFSAEGYSWKLQLYPNGNTKSNGADHISLYLAIGDFPSNKDVHVEFKFFVFDQNDNNYLMIRDGTVKRFHKMKKELGYDQLLKLDTFKDPSYGYLVDDCCEFGVELFVISSTTSKRQSFTLVQPSSTLLPFKRTFVFSKLVETYHYANSPISFADKAWKLKIYPKGYGNEEGNSLSVFLELVDAAKLTPGQQVFAEYKLRVIDQRRDNHVEHTVRHWFSSSNTQSWGFPKFMPLGDLYEAKKGFVMNDNLIVEVEFVDVSVTNVFSS